MEDDPGAVGSAAQVAVGGLKIAGGAALRVAAGAWRRTPVTRASAGRHDKSAGGGGKITTREVRSHEGDPQPWMLVDVAQSGAEATQSAKWSLKAQAFRSMEKAEEQRKEHFAQWSAAQASSLAALQRQAARGKEEQAECVAFLQQRAAADLAYAASFSKHRLGGKPVSQLADLRAAALPGVPGSGAPALSDAGGCAELAAVMSVLGCMLSHAADRLQRFGEQGGLGKELQASQEAYTSACELATKTFDRGLDAMARLDRGCSDAFAAHRTAFDTAQRQAGELAPCAPDGGKDFWLSEFHYRAAVGAFGRTMWSTGGAVRSLLESFRAAEHRRIATLHGTLRVLVSLQQRLWADVSASTSTVHAVFKELPAATGLADDPKAIALEHLISTGCDEYASRPALPPSALVLHEAPLLYQRAVLRSWASARGVVTRDGFLHLFGVTGGGSELRPDQLLFSVKIAPAPARALLRDEHSHTFEVPTIVSGLLGKVGLTSDRAAPVCFRSPDHASLVGWMRALETVHACPPASIPGGEGSVRHAAGGPAGSGALEPGGWSLGQSGATRQQGGGCAPFEFGASAEKGAAWGSSGDDASAGAAAEAPACIGSAGLDAFASLDPFALQQLPVMAEEAALAPDSLPRVDRGDATGGAGGGAPLSADDLRGVDSLRLEDLAGVEASFDGASQLGDEDDLSLPDLFAE